MTHHPVDPTVVDHLALDEVALEESAPAGSPVARPARRPRRIVLAATALLAVLGTVALALAGGERPGSTNDAGTDLALGGVQAPGEAGPGKRLGGQAPSEKVVGGLGAKGTSTTAAGTSTTAATGAGAGAAAIVAGRAATGATATTTVGSAGAGAPTTAAPAPGVAPTTSTAGRGGTTPPTTAPSTTVRPTGGTFTPTGPTYWLATDGNDGGNGSESAPWRSFAHALGSLRPGDTLLVRAGTYGTFSSPAIDVSGLNGTAAAPITIAAAPGQAVTLRGGGWQVVYVQNSSYVDVRGFEVVGNAPADHSTSNGIEMRGSHHVRIIGNTVHDVGGGGISANNTNHITIDGNRVYNTSNWNNYQTSGISLFESTNIGGGNNADGFSFYIRNNIVWNNRTLVGVVSDGNCIIVDSNRHTGYTGATSITNNLCYGNGGRGVHVFIADNVVAVNNTLVGNLQSPEMADSGELSAIQAGNITFRNNLVVAGRETGGTHVYAASNVTFANNLFTGSAPAQHGASDRIVADARLGGDYVPLAGSPAIDGGTADGAPTVDRRGRARTGAPDIGCYEA